MARYQLANDGEGNPLEVPEGAVAWRVRRGGGRRGRPRIVFDNETGRQLEVPLEATINDLVDHGCPPGRYRLEAVDGEGRLIAGCVGVTEIPVEADDADEVPASTDKFERHMLAIERLVDVVCRSQEAMAQAFGPLRPAQAAPMIVESSAPGVEKSESEGQLVEFGSAVAKQIMDYLREKRDGGAVGGAQ